MIMKDMEQRALARALGALGGLGASATLLVKPFF